MKKPSVESIDTFLEQPGAARAIRELTKLLSSNLDRAALQKAASTIIYRALTMRGSFVREIELSGDASEFVRLHEPHIKWYGETLAAIDSAVAQYGMVANENPAWFGISTYPEKETSEGRRHKRYVTLPTEQYATVAALPSLARKLREVAAAHEDPIKVKVPRAFTGFVAHPDSLVIHYSDEDSLPGIEAALAEWLAEQNITEAPRELGRMKYAADSENLSFSESVSNQIGEWLHTHAKDYDHALLAREAVKHAILQSQQHSKLV